MKKVLNKLIALGSIGLVMLSACKKDGTVVTSTGGKPGTLAASSTTFSLDKTRLNDTSAAITFSFTMPTYSFSAAVTNTLEIDSVGDNWKKPASVTLATRVLTQSYSTAAFNSLLLKLNFKGGVAAQIQARVVHSLATNVAPLYSNVVNLTVTPFNLASFIYVVGGYNLYTPANADSLLSATSNNVYVGVIPFTAGNGADGANYDFKVILNKQNFNGNYGYASTITLGATTGFPAATTVEGISNVNGGNGNLFVSPGATDDAATQIYSSYISLDLNKNTISITPTQWGVVGSATPGSWPNSSGYQDDIDMHYNNATQTWSVVATLTGGNQIKFRLNHDWNTNLGGSNGVLASGGSNINIATTGSYLITIDPVGLTYSVVPQ